MQQTLFQLKFTAKQLVRSSKKCEKNEKTQRKKIKKAIEQGNMEGARIYATNAIREKKQALNFLKLSSRIDGVRVRRRKRVFVCARGGSCVVVGVCARREGYAPPLRSHNADHAVLPTISPSAAAQCTCAPTGCVARRNSGVDGSTDTLNGGGGERHGGRAEVDGRRQDYCGDG